LRDEQYWKVLIRIKIVDPVHASEQLIEVPRCFRGANEQSKARWSMVSSSRIPYHQKI